MKKLFTILAIIASVLAIILSVLPLSNLAIIPSIIALISGLIAFYLSKKTGEVKEVFFQRYKYDTSKDLLGSGGFGKVYKAYDDILNKRVAIKISPVQEGRENLSLLSEVELAKKLPHHRNIAHYEDCFRLPI